jgi:hypothetical protein
MRPINMGIKTLDFLDYPIPFSTGSCLLLYGRLCSAKKRGSLDVYISLERSAILWRHIKSALGGAVELIAKVIIIIVIAEISPDCCLGKKGNLA